MVYNFPESRSDSGFCTVALVSLFLLIPECYVLTPRDCYAS